MIILPAEAAPIQARQWKRATMGSDFRVVATIPKGGSPEHTVAFPRTLARYFRVTFRTMRTPGPDGTPDIALAELVLHPDARVNRFEEKAAFTQMPDLYGFATPDVSPDRHPQERRD